MKRHDIAFLPNCPRLLGQLRPEFEITHSEPTLDAPESIARGSAVGFVSDTETIVTQGHVSRPGWRPRVAYVRPLPNPAQLRAMARPVRPACVPGRHCERYARGLGGCVAGYCKPPAPEVDRG